MILTPLQKLPKNGKDWAKLIVAKGFKKLPKVQNITESGHTVYQPLFPYFYPFMTRFEPQISGVRSDRSTRELTPLGEGSLYSWSPV